MSKIYHYWMFESTVRKEVFDIVDSKNNPDRLTRLTGKPLYTELTRLSGNKRHNSRVHTSDIDKLQNANIFLSEENDELALQYFQEYLAQAADKALKTAETYQQRLANFTGKIKLMK